MSRSIQASVSVTVRPLTLTWPARMRSSACVREQKPSFDKARGSVTRLPEDGAAGLRTGAAGGRRFCVGLERRGFSFISCGFLRRRSRLRSTLSFRPLWPVGWRGRATCLCPLFEPATSGEITSGTRLPYFWPRLSGQLEPFALRDGQDGSCPAFPVDPSALAILCPASSSPIWSGCDQNPVAKTQL
ncbi:hypothetical protein D3C80_367260 [compost metagenome]